LLALGSAEARASSQPTSKRSERLYAASELAACEVLDFYARGDGGFFAPDCLL
jgi:hypothetical protein